LQNRRFFFLRSAPLTQRLDNQFSPPLHFADRPEPPPPAGEFSDLLQSPICALFFLFVPFLTSSQPQLGNQYAPSLSASDSRLMTFFYRLPAFFFVDAFFFRPPVQLFLLCFYMAHPQTPPGSSATPIVAEEPLCAIIREHRGTLPLFFVPFEFSAFSRPPIRLLFFLPGSPYARGHRRYSKTPPPRQSLFLPTPASSLRMELPGSPIRFLPFLC